LCQQVAHKIFTTHPQLFHSWARCGSRDPLLMPPM
jgi:hypothetical protein